MWGYPWVLKEIREKQLHSFSSIIRPPGRTILIDEVHVTPLIRKGRQGGEVTVAVKALIIRKVGMDSINKVRKVFSYRGDLNFHILLLEVTYERISTCMKLNHSNVLPLLGLLRDDQQRLSSLVLPWKACRSLTEYLSEHHSLRLPYRISIVCGSYLA